MPRFVLLFHECPRGYERPSHWDFMLEAGETLRAWALMELPIPWSEAHLKTRASHPDSPALAAGRSVAAHLLDNHRRAYLELEGPVSDDRGVVTRIAAGVFNIAAEAGTELEIYLDGGCLKGKTRLSQAGPNTTEWLLACESNS